MKGSGKRLSNTNTQERISQEKIIEALKHNIEHFKKIREQCDKEGRDEESSEAHLIWYYLSCSLEGICFE